MPITGWIAILVLIVMCYMLIKQYETRMVLFGGGFILCCISLTPMAGLNAFAKTMTNGALIMAICSATGFAYCVTFTECDRSLVHYLTRPIRNVGILMIPITSLLTFAINIAIPSAAGVGAVVGTTLIPLLLRAGFKPAAAAAAVLMGTTGSLLSPGLSHNAYVSDMAHMSIMDLISYHGIYSLMIGVVGAVGLCIVCWVLGDNKGEKIAEANPASDAEPSNFKANPIKAFVPLIPIHVLDSFRQEGRRTSHADRYDRLSDRCHVRPAEVLQAVLQGHGRLLRKHHGHHHCGGRVGGRFNCFRLD